MMILRNLLLLAFPAVLVGAGKITDQDRQYWAYKALSNPKVPVIKGYSNHPIDRFIQQTLQENGLKPSLPAAKRDLIRRAYFDLVGFPPSAAEVDKFVSSKDPKAYEKLLDKLLASPRYGERWGRHWLDLVRYAESDGYRGDFYRPLAYKYRDYVIRSFNQDKSYQQFVMEQLAGDEIDPGNPEAIIATGYMRLPIYEWNQRDAETHWETILQDVTDVTADVFLGSGLQCAKCHDHKFDPILQKDYFALKAFFAPMKWRNDVPAATPQQVAKRNDWKKAQEENFQKIKTLEDAHRKRIYKKAISIFPKNIQEMMAKKESQRSPYEKQMAYLVMEQAYYDWNKSKDKKELKKKHKTLYESVKKEEVKLPQAMTVTDVGNGVPPTRIPGKKENILPGFMTVLYPQGANVDATVQTPSKAPNSSGRRTALAKWITNPNNPLTTRVIVNRIWQYHFGKGIAANPNDFGQLGPKPTHPELLDWLTQKFIANGWSFKYMHKLIMMSETYRQTSEDKNSEDKLKKDPQNTLLWKFSSKRLEAEAIRDSILAVSGELRFRNKGGSSVPGDKNERSIYVKVIRNEKDEFLHSFDWADAFASNAVRNVTTTPLQSLLMINGKWVKQKADAFAKTLSKKYKKNYKAIIKHVYREAYGRSPSSKELKMSLEFLNSKEAKLGDFCQVIFNTSEFLYVR